MAKQNDLVNIDLDVCDLIQNIGLGDEIVLYLRGGSDEIEDFFFFKGNLEYGAEGLANLMKQSGDLQWMIVEALKIFSEE